MADFRDPNDFDWQWEENGESPHNSSHGVDRQFATRQLIYKDSPALLSNFVSAVVGYPRRGEAGRVSRPLPLQHPEFPWMYAVGVPRAQGIIPFGVRTARSKRAVYKWVKLSVDFATPAYTVAPDDTFPKEQEYKRNVVRGWDSTRESLNLPSGAFKWAEGPRSGQTIPSPPSVFVTRWILTYRWFALPADGFFTGSGSLPRWQKFIGQVNEDDFDGYAAGTLLFLPPKITQRVAPVKPTLMWKDADDMPPYFPPVMYDVEIRFHHFDPPYFDASHRGWQTVPVPGDAQQRWALATADGTVGGPRIYPEISYADIFELEA